jgi:hypothetical protein
MPELATVLREVVDASAAPVTVEEVLGLPEALPRRRRRWPSLAAAAVVVVLAGAAALALRTVADDAADTVPATTVAPEVEVPPLVDCEVVPDQVGGCAVTDDEAEAMVGFRLNEPDGIPEGWERTIHDVRVYRAADWPGVGRDLVESNRAWFPPTNCGMPNPPVDGCVADYVQVSIRGASGNEAFPDRQAGELADGTPVFGGAGLLTWQADGRHYEVQWHGIDDDEARAIADSLE